MSFFSRQYMSHNLISISIIYLNAGFTISPCLRIFNVLFLHVQAISYHAMVKNFFFDFPI